jgi:hypothetical protein
MLIHGVQSEDAWPELLWGGGVRLLVAFHTTRFCAGIAFVVTERLSTDCSTRGFPLIRYSQSFSRGFSSCTNLHDAHPGHRTINPPITDRQAKGASTHSVTDRARCKLHYALGSSTASSRSSYDSDMTYSNPALSCSAIKLPLPPSYSLHLNVTRTAPF